jgi:hypothetical protein
MKNKASPPSTDPTKKCRALFPYFPSLESRLAGEHTVDTVGLIFVNKLYIRREERLVTYCKAVRQVTVFPSTCRSSSSSSSLFNDAFSATQTI